MIIWIQLLTKYLIVIFKEYYPKVEYPRSDFLKYCIIIRDLIITIQQVSIMQVLFTRHIITDIII